MDEIKVSYYDTFRCSADKCPYTCCQEWEITFDEETYQVWEGAHVNGKPLHDYLEKEDEAYNIALDCKGQCTLLNDNKLCSLVVEKGEAYLCSICKTYPRQINTFTNRTEYGLDFGCPAVIDLIRQHGIGFTHQLEEMTDKERLRQCVLTVLQLQEGTLTQRILLAAHLLSEAAEEVDLTPDILAGYEDTDYQECLLGEIADVRMAACDSFWERNELFLDMTNLYRQEGNYADYLETIGMWAQRLEGFYTDAVLEAKLEAFESQYKAYEQLMQDYLVAENWASILQQESSVEDMAMVYQWVVLEYCTMKHAIFLSWLADDEVPLTYEKVRDYVMLIARLSAYDTPEIKNCMCLSYDATYLAWEHLALLVGNHAM